MSKPHFTKTEQRIITMLMDGEVHSCVDLRGCLDDKLSVHSALKMHLSRLRKKLRLQGEDIVFTASKRLWGYRHMRTLNSRGNEK